MEWISSNGLTIEVLHGLRQLETLHGYRKRKFAMSVKIDEKAVILVKCPDGHVVRTMFGDWDRDSESAEKSPDGMGVQTCHRFTLEGVECARKGCGKTIDAWIEVTEYPNGILEGENDDQIVECSSNVVDKHAVRQAMQESLD